MENGFRIVLNVAYFEPKDLKVIFCTGSIYNKVEKPNQVSLSDQVLTVTGERKESLANTLETLQRSFDRQYALPEDIKLNTIRASIITEKGTLEITVCD